MEIPDTIIAFKRCVELGLKSGGKLLDLEILDMLIKSCLEDFVDSDGEGCSKHRKALGGLITYLVSVVSNSVGLFLSASEFSMGGSEYKNGLEYLKKAWRVQLNLPGMNLDEGKFSVCVDVTVKLVNGYLKYGKEVEENRMGSFEVVCGDWVYQAKTCLKTVMSRCGDWEMHEKYGELEKCLEEIKNVEINL